MLGGAQKDRSLVCLEKFLFEPGLLMMRLRIVITSILLIFAVPHLFSETAARGIKNVFWQPNELEQGSPVFITVELEKTPIRLTGKWIGKDVTFFKSNKPRVWYALAGVDLETQPGTYELSLKESIRGRAVLHSTKKVDISAANFPSGTAEVPENFVEPDEASKKKIAADEVLKKRAFSHLIARPQWSGNFVMPADAKPTDSFGASRLLNEELTSTHRGTDFQVKEGEPVRVSNSGTVVLAKELFYEGNCVIVDHGQRLFTIYMHLSKIQVRVGNKLRKSQQLGLSGETGRVTGPHLHMAVRWNGAYVDPTKLIALTLPELGPERVHREPRKP
jgi:murein DD-endopeptidase MepM/ murein hydrolase activator NlpD